MFTTEKQNHTQKRQKKKGGGRKKNIIRRGVSAGKNGKNIRYETIKNNNDKGQPLI